MRRAADVQRLPLLQSERVIGRNRLPVALGLKWRAEDAEADIRLGDERRAAQRNFQANAKAIETSTTMTQAIINIRG